MILPVIFLYEHYVCCRLQTFTKNTTANETHGYTMYVSLTGNQHKVFIILTRGWELNYIRLVISFTQVEMSLQVPIYIIYVYILWSLQVILFEGQNINLAKLIDVNLERIIMHILCQLQHIFNAVYGLVIIPINRRRLK